MKTPDESTTTSFQTMLYTENQKGTYHQHTLFPRREETENQNQHSNDHIPTSPVEMEEWGTFKDSRKAPIHNWFLYPTGFSNKAVESALRYGHLTPAQWVYDPFMGTATTGIVARSLGINSIGVEAHPFIYFVGKTKIFWDIETQAILRDLQQVKHHARKIMTDDSQLQEEFPVLIHKCFSQNTLWNLSCLKKAIMSLSLSDTHKDFFVLALTCVLRSVANVATGWPYVDPKKKKKEGKEKDVYAVFSEMVIRMCHDIQTVKRSTLSHAECLIFNGDARDTRACIDDESIDCIFTSPPYLNNYDYADRTRLETYFWGWAKSWRDITNAVRTKLIMSATTQINRADYRVDDIISDELKAIAPEIAMDLQQKVNALSQIRLRRGGKKSYDILVGQYVNDMFQVLRDCFRVLKQGRSMFLILGDSAPYGVYIPTDIVMGDLARCVGFSDYEITDLRKRGGKWRENPQRHRVGLREVILHLKK